MKQPGKAETPKQPINLRRLSPRVCRAIEEGSSRSSDFFPDPGQWCRSFGPKTALALKAVLKTELYLADLAKKVGESPPPEELWGVVDLAYEYVARIRAIQSRLPATQSIASRPRITIVDLMSWCDKVAGLQDDRRPEGEDPILEEILKRIREGNLGERASVFVARKRVAEVLGLSPDAFRKRIVKGQEKWPNVRMEQPGRAKRKMAGWWTHEIEHSAALDPDMLSQLRRDPGYPT